ncbi:MAG: c-type cytochrome [Candidatus Acidiferrales bacterium]
MKNFFVGAISALLLLAVGAFIYLRTGMAEVRADFPPPRWETYVMQTAVHSSIKREAPEIPSPVQATNENLIAGGKFYLGACAGCHGTPGKPQGSGGAVLYPPIPELPVVGTELSEAQIFFVAKHGIRRSGMFANGVWASDQELWTVTAYIKRMDSLPAGVKEAIEKKP